MTQNWQKKQLQWWLACHVHKWRWLFSALKIVKSDLRASLKEDALINAMYILFLRVRIIGVTIALIILSYLRLLEFTVKKRRNPDPLLKPEILEKLCFKLYRKKQTGHKQLNVSRYFSLRKLTTVPCRDQH